MTISFSFSGGVNHKSEVPVEKQKELAENFAAAIKGICENNGASGSGTVAVGSETASILASSSVSVD
jgi:hypothetical protein